MALITGTPAADILTGTAANDTVIGEAGNDTASMGAGNDLFVWDPGDGSDVIEGQAGVDTLRFNAADDPELISIAAVAGGRITLERGSDKLDLNDVERIQITASGGGDIVVVNDLAGTDVKFVSIDLAGDPGGKAGAGVLDIPIVYGNDGNNNINVGSAGKSVSVTGLAAQTVIAHADATDLLIVASKAGDDKINASKLTAGIMLLQVNADDGNDTVTGSAGADAISGGAGNDSIIGGAGGDTLNGFDGNDTLVGGKGDDQMSGEAGNDAMIWNAGDGTDLVEGGSEIDTIQINGGKASEVFTATANGVRVRFDVLSPIPSSLDIGTTESMVLNAGAGNDSFSATGNLAALIGILVDGGAGNDTLLGGNGVDLLIGGDGNDSIDGNQGNDVAFLGKGNDVFQWDPGDGSDIVEGQAGFDILRFNGSAGNEIFAVSANGGRTLFTRDLGNIVMDLDDVERIEIRALGGTDTLTVNDLTGTDVKQVAIDLTAVGGAGDGAVDNVIVNGTDNKDVINVALSGKNIGVFGLQALTTVAGAEATDSLVVNALGGDDKITASKLQAGLINLTIDSGAGNDTIAGSLGVDVMIAGGGNDSVVGDDGNDVAFLGAGNDLFVWNNGDGSDIVEGQADIDTLRFNSSGAAEFIEVSANGGRSLLTRDVGGVVMDMDDMEHIEIRAGGGADSIVINDLTGTDVTEITVDLAAAPGGASPDNKIDLVTVGGTAVKDQITIASVGGQIVTSGLPDLVIVTHGAKSDILTVNGLGGDDFINASSLLPGKISLQMVGGIGADIFIGSAGNDTVSGGDGEDIAFLGLGNDLFVWNPGDDNDTIEGQGGLDTLRFNGSNAAENIDISANGGRAIFFRNVANVVMDIDDVERIEFQAVGGADNIVVNDLSGTDVKQVAIDLGAAAGGGDGGVDTVTVDGTAGADKISVSLVAGDVSVNGLSTQVTIDDAEAANDRLVILGLGGNDLINASKLPASALSVELNGGADNDTLLGGGNNDLLRGGAGADSLGGGAGNDTVFGDAGNDTIAVGQGNDTIAYSSVLDGHDVVSKFDGNPVGGQDTVDLDALFDGLGIATVDRAARVNIVDKGATVDVNVDTDGNVGNGFEVIVTLQTADTVTLGEDVLVGSL